MININKILTSKRSLVIKNIIIIPILLLLTLDSIGNSETVHKFLGIQSYQLVTPTILLFLFVRWKYGVFLNSKFNALLKIFSLTGLIVATVLTIYDNLTHTNAAFALTRLNQANLLLLTVTIGIIFLINKSNHWWHKNQKRVLFLTPFIFYYLAAITRLFPFDIFLQLVKEDHFVENSQFWILIIGSLTSFFIAIHFERRKKRIISIFFAICGLAFFFIAGDEIAWGQRVLGIEISETIKQENHQQELTIHNLYTFEWLVIYGYLILSACGVFSRFLCEKISLLKKFLIFTPSYLLFGYFLFPFIYFFMQLIVNTGIWHEWSEVAELFLYSGIVIWIIILGFNLLKNYKKIVGTKLHKNTCSFLCQNFKST